MSYPAKKISESGRQLLEKIRAGNKDAFEKLFYSYYHDLCSLAFKVTHCPQQARDVVQDVFLNLWNKHSKWNVKVSIKAYLYQAVWNEALNAQAREKRKLSLKKEFAEISAYEVESEAREFSGNRQRLITEIWNIVANMPERRKSVFILHRKHALTYKEIGRVLQISPKTVENHMGLALTEIREKMDDRHLR